MTLSTQEVTSLERVRNRLVQIQQGLDGLRQKLQKAQSASNGPLPSWEELQESALTFARNMEMIQATFEENRDFLTAAHAYPHANFPATKPGGHGVMTELLRKKPEPDVEAWMKEYTDENRVKRRDKFVDVEGGLSGEKQRELWAFAHPTASGIEGEMREMGALDYDFTLAEHAKGVESVKTGLRKQLQATMVAEDEVSEDEEMEDADAGVKKVEEGEESDVGVKGRQLEEDRLGKPNGLVPGGFAMRLDDVCKFLSAGVLPAGRA